MCLISLIGYGAGFFLLFHAIAGTLIPLFRSRAQQGVVGVLLMVGTGFLHWWFVWRKGARYVPETGAKAEMHVRDEIIKCPNCAMHHSRAEVVSVLRDQSPEMFEFGSWSTRFKCRRCKQEIWISRTGCT